MSSAVESYHRDFSFAELKVRDASVRDQQPDP